MNIIPNEYCYLMENNTNKRKYFNKGFCVLGKKYETIAAGDSGSPIIWEDPNDNYRAYLVGIASKRNPAKYVKVIDGESKDSKDLLKFWFNGGVDFDDTICVPHKPGCHLNHTIDYLRDQERELAKKPRLSI